MVADPEGLIEVWADDWSLVENYRFGTGTCDFLICRRCGVFIAAVSEMATGARAANLARNREFESRLLQQRGHCEPDFFAFAAVFSVVRAGADDAGNLSADLQPPIVARSRTNPSARACASSQPSTSRRHR